MSIAQFAHATVLALVLLMMNGCSRVDNPGTWDEPKVESYMMEKMNLETIDLSPTADGFEGSGKNAAGETYDLKVTQQASDKRLDYEATGDRGTNETGFYSTL